VFLPAMIQEWPMGASVKRILVFGILGWALTMLSSQAQTTTLAFELATYSVREDVGSITISVIRSAGTNGTVSVNFATSDGTATAGLDYVANSGTLTFTSGVTVASFTITVLNDSNLESNETVNLTLSSPTGGAALGTPSTAVLTIRDDDAPSIQFAADSFEVQENAGEALITLVRSGDLNTAVTVEFTTADGSATAGDDYATTTQTVEFAEGETTNSVTVAISNDDWAETDETVNLKLSHPTGGAVLGNRDTATLTIRDDEPPQLQFSTNQYSQIEGAGSATITVIRLGSAAGTGTIHYSTDNNTAISGEDYLRTSGTLTFLPGQSSKSFSVTILDDTMAESNETVRLTLSDPTGDFDLGAPAEAALTIVNDDRQIMLFLDEDGDEVTATLTGHGAMDIAWAGGHTGSVESVLLSATDATTTLSIRVRKRGDGLLQIGEIIADGSLRRLDAKACDLTGSIEFAGDFPGLKTTIALHEIADEVSIQLANPIAKLTAARIGACEIHVPEIGNLSVAGDKRRGITGDFLALLNLTGLETNKTMLGGLSVAGQITNAIINTTVGSIGNVRASAMVDSAIFAGYTPHDDSRPLASGDFLPALRIGSLNVRGAGAAFRNSFVAAAKFGRASLSGVEWRNDNVEYGIFAPEAIGSVNVRSVFDGAEKIGSFRWKRNGSDDQTAGDFHVKQ
jgi:flagellar basal body rod protein FlgG